MMEKKLPVKQCPVCVREDHEYIDAKVAKTEMTDQEAAKHCGVSYRVYAAHYYEHVMTSLVNALSTDIMPIKEIVVDKINTVSESVDRLRKLVLTMSDTVYKENKFDNKTIQSIVSLERSLTQTVKDLAIIQGEITMGDTVNIQQNIVKAEKLMNIVMEDACHVCKENFLKKLESESNSEVITVATNAT